METATGNRLDGLNRPAESSGDGATAALSDRVRSLRLPAEHQGRTGGAWAAWTLCLLFAVSTATLTYLVAVKLPREASAGSQAASAEAASPESGAAIPSVPTSAGQPASSQGVVLESSGYIIPTEQILVSPEVTGRIIELNIVEGRTVKKSDVLAKLDPTDYLSEKDRATAAVELASHHLAELQSSRPDEIGAARAELEEAEAQLPQIEAEWKRATRLTEQNVVAKEDYELAESKHRAMQRKIQRLEFALKLMASSREIRIKAAEAEVRQAQAELSKAQWRIDKCTISAPIDGMILKKNAERWNVVNPVAFNGSYSLCDLADLSKLEVDLAIPERDIPKVFVGQSCRLHAEAYPDRHYDGRVSRLMPIADRGKGSISVRVEIQGVPREEEGVYLKPEMRAVVSFLGQKQEPR